MKQHLLFLALWLVSFFPATASEPHDKLKAANGSISGATQSKDGFLVHNVESPYQQGVTQVFVLKPDRLEDGQQARVIYVLPVEPGTGTRWGNGLLEIKKLDLHNKLGVIFVMPTFSDWPWYCDHPTNPLLRQETYLLEVVVPFIERTYPVVPGQAGRLLLGFSKSGWGAFSLLLRYPDVFGRAAAWDAPLNMAAPDQFGMGPIFGTQENFEKYRISALLSKQAAKLQASKRLALIGHSNFRPHHQAIHEHMVRLEIPHEFRDVRHGKHDWQSGWLEDAVNFLLSTARKSKDTSRSAEGVEFEKLLATHSEIEQDQARVAVFLRHLLEAEPRMTMPLDLYIKYKNRVYREIHEGFFGKKKP